MYWRANTFQEFASFDVFDTSNREAINVPFVCGSRILAFNYKSLPNSFVERT